MANINALKNQAAKFVVKGNYAKALEIYNKVKELDPEEPGIYNLIGDVYLKRGEKEKAIEEFKKSLELYVKVQYYPNAIAVCKKIIRTDKNQSDVYKSLASLYVERGFIGEAVINYLEYASRMRAEGNKQEEINAYKKVIELGPSKVDIRERLVDLYIAEGETDAAVEELEKIEELLIEQGKQSKLPEIEEKLAALKIGEVPSEKSEKGETEVKEEHKVQLGFTMEDMVGEGVSVKEPEGEKEEEAEEVEKEVKEAEEIKEGPEEKVKEEAKERTVEKTEEEISLEEEIEKLHRATKIPTEEETTEAIPTLEKSELQPAPTQWTNFEELAELCLSVNSKDEAVDYFYKAGQIYLDESNYEKAIKVYKRIIDIRPLELRPRQKLIEISMKMEDKEAAGEWNLDLGKCLYEKGAIEEAEKAFQRAEDLISNTEKLRAEIEKIKGTIPVKKEKKVVKKKIETKEKKEEKKLHFTWRTT
ncbi:MAG: hypothetical protein B5M53_08710 [Candidatus Cloacimonas sp. 4484_209]|nr:MAG: hypothetical protein B5M53_08710 [Candidatus Cloacimonas sp. 4484_209]